MSYRNINFGKSAEKYALDFLKGKGYKILRQNYRNKLGEIDIIAQEKEVICFIEVKARSSDKFGLPEEAINANKQKKIARIALSYLKEHKLMDRKARFDALCISGNENRLVKDAFELGGEYVV